ncbi:alpha-L-rhamnosidase-related protein [Loigolactobacillus jiayinensis]|uniref:Amylo-alpha-1,6-glucosidase n=1 Tax=Loigolactobacillus jiayinensis TaxID=2486016 RepID=A0ABW1REN3_9LACO|nr:amylo-alpha-1,6-glucosidase [Loigolactobacillus jiayinensis]
MSKWIWYQGDFEIYHSMKQNFDREERGGMWPAYWYTSGWNHNVVFSKVYELTEPQNFNLVFQGHGYVKITELATAKESKFPLDATINCPAGQVKIEISVGNLSGLPCIYVMGKKINSDSDWLVTNFIGDAISVGCSSMFVNKEQNPMVFEYQHELRQANKVEHVNGGTLFDFGHDITAQVIVQYERKFTPITLCYGESKTEALDVEACYLKHNINTPANDKFGQYDTKKLAFKTRLRAFRYLFLPNLDTNGVLQITADYQFVPFPQKGYFTSVDQQLNQIWQVADRTFRLCSGNFFIDGIKRDRWVWSGDAFQSYFINQYDFFDKEIVKRTILGLRGELEVKQHLNTIVDYSMYWIISIELYYQTFADKEFVRQTYPKMKALLDYCLAQTNNLGFILGRSGDWIYIDWADFDHAGALCAEQILLARALQSMIRVEKILGKATTETETRYQKLRANIDRYFWDADKQAYIDSYESGKRNVTRHANIFAILFGYTTEEQTKEIVTHVIQNSQVPQINTPYFKFWELEVLAQTGQFKNVLQQIKNYWGGMLENGATTFWEYFDPTEQGAAKYAMYGDKYGKSLCHAWGASPIYLIGRYLMGVEPTSPGYQTFKVTPQVELFQNVDCAFPLNEAGDSVQIKTTATTLAVLATKAGGTLIYQGKQIELPPNQQVTVTL